MNYKVWNKTSSINELEPQHFLSKPPFKNYEGDIILIYGKDDKVSQVECKDILASVYGIDKTLSLDEFMTQYFAKLTQIETIEINENSEINETSDKSLLKKHIKSSIIK